MNKKITSFFITRLNRWSGFLLLFAIFLIGGLFFCCDQKISAQISEEKFSKKRKDEILYKLKNQSEVLSLKVETGDYDRILAELKSNPALEYAEPNYLYKAAIIPSDTYYSNQWYLKKIKAPEAWDKVRESPEITIAVIDSGVQIKHPDLKDNIWRNIYEAPGNNIDDDKNGYVDDLNGWDFVNNMADPSPKFNEGYTADGILHGTIVSGLIAASGNNAAGVVGVTWRAKIMALRVLDDNGEGDTKNVIKAIDYAIANDADILNFSFVGFNYSHSLDQAIKRAYESGIIVVAAAGNEKDQGYGYSLDATPMYPACHDGQNGENMVIGVAATDALDQKASFSSYGFRCVDIAAPGVSFFSTTVYSPDNQIDGLFFNKYYDGYWSGTSMATPLVSGATALVEAANPRLSRSEVIDVLINSADNINRLNPNFLGQLGSGRLNMFKAITAAKSELYNQEHRLIVAPFANNQPQIKIVNQEGIKEKEFFAYAESFRGGVNVSVGDVDGDGRDEIVTGAGSGGGPHIRIFNQTGEVIGQFFAYDKNFRGGVNVSVGDVDGDGRDEIVTGAGSGAYPEIRVYSLGGKLKNKFFAYDKNFRGGVNVSVGDVDGDGRDEIVTGAGSGGGPQVRIFSDNGKIEGQFFAYDKKSRGGVKVSIARMEIGARNNKEKIVTAPNKKDEPLVKIFDNHAQVLNEFLAYDKNFIGGINLSAADFDYDGVDEIITGAAGEGAPHVRIFTRRGVLTNSFYAFEVGFSGGVSVAGINMNK